MSCDPVRVDHRNLVVHTQQGLSLRHPPHVLTLGQRWGSAGAVEVQGIRTSKLGRSSVGSASHTRQLTLATDSPPGPSGDRGQDAAGPGPSFLPHSFARTQTFTLNSQ